MTSEEAYKILTENYYNCTYCDNLCDDCEYYIAQDIAVKALKKQVPQKPKRLHNSENYSPKCICCDKYIPTYNAMRKMKYCPHCGQAIKWGD